MQEKTKGIVLHTTKYGENSVIAEIFTEQRGTVAFVVRLPKSRKSALKGVLLHPLSLLDIDYDYRENRKLQQISDMRLHIPYQSIPYHPIKETIALFLSEFLFYALRDEQENTSLYQYLLHSLMWLDERTERFGNFPITFLIRLTLFLGIKPDITEPNSLLRAEEQTYLPLIMRMDFSTMHLFTFTREQRTRILEVLNNYYRTHVPGFPELRSMAIMREVLS